MKLYMPVLLVTCGFFGCDRSNAVGTTRTTGANVPVNTALNPVEDKSSSAAPMSQGETPEELNTTQEIRHALMTDDSLSASAKGVEIITYDGVITLRGSVRSAMERNDIERTAWASANGNRVDDQIDVDPNR